MSLGSPTICLSEGQLSVHFFGDKNAFSSPKDLTPAETEAAAPCLPLLPKADPSKLASFLLATQALPLCQASCFGPQTISPSQHGFCCLCAAHLSPTEECPLTQLCLPHTPGTRSVGIPREPLPQTSGIGISEVGPASGFSMSSRGF